MIASPAFSGKRYAVLGLARSGMTALECLLASGASVTAWDSREEPRRALEGRAGVDLADPATIDLTGYAGGIPIKRWLLALEQTAGTFELLP